MAERLGAVTVVYRGSKDEAETAVKAITAQGGRAIAVQADVADEAAMARVFDATEEAFGGVDVVVNAAGVMVLAPVAEFDLDALDRMHRTNIRGTFVVAQQAVRRVRTGGAIINFSTSVTKLALPTYAGYAATKGAVDAVSLVLAKELRGRDITVNAVAPGPTATALFLDGRTRRRSTGWPRSTRWSGWAPPTTSPRSCPSSPAGPADQRPDRLRQRRHGLMNGTATAIVLITGAGTGIGALTARSLAAVGHTVYATMRDPEGCNRARATALREYADETGTDLRVIELDVTSSASAAAAADTVIAERGRHRRARAQRRTPLLRHHRRLHPRAGPGLLRRQPGRRAARRPGRAPHMRAARSGLLVWVGSGTSRIVPPFLTPHTAAKAAMDPLTESVAWEVARFGIETTIACSPHPPVTPPRRVVADASDFGAEPVNGSAEEQRLRLARRMDVTARRVAAVPPCSGPG